MEFGNASWGFRETPLEKQLQVTHEMGLDLLELGIAGHQNDFVQLEADDRIIDNVKGLFSRYGIKLLCGSTGNDFTRASESECLKDLEKVRKVVDLAVKLGIANVRIFAGFSPASEVVGGRWETMIRCLRESAEYAAGHGVSVAVETHGGVECKPGGVRHFSSTSSKPELFLKMLDQLSSNIKVVFDPANLGAVGMDEKQITTLYRKLEPKIAYMHLKDFKPAHAGRIVPCACGEGNLDWKKLMKVFSGFFGPGMIEYENVEDIERGLRYSLSVLETAM